jgi:hypothetical protein
MGAMVVDFGTASKGGGAKKLWPGLFYKGYNWLRQQVVGCSGLGCCK